MENPEILYIFKYQISRFLPISFPGSGTQFGTGIPGSDSGTGRSNIYHFYMKALLIYLVELHIRKMSP